MSHQNPRNYLLTTRYPLKLIQNWRERVHEDARRDLEKNEMVWSPIWHLQCSQTTKQDNHRWEWKGVGGSECGGERNVQVYSSLSNEELQRCCRHPLHHQPCLPDMVQLERDQHEESVRWGWVCPNMCKERWKGSLWLHHCQILCLAWSRQSPEGDQVLLPAVSTWKEVSTNRFSKTLSRCSQSDCILHLPNLQLWDSPNDRSLLVGWEWSCVAELCDWYSNKKESRLRRRQRSRWRLRLRDPWTIEHLQTVEATESGIVDQEGWSLLDWREEVLHIRWDLRREARITDEWFAEDDAGALLDHQTGCWDQ